MEYREATLNNFTFKFLIDYCKDIFLLTYGIKVFCYYHILIRGRKSFQNNATFIFNVAKTPTVYSRSDKIEIHPAI